MNRFSRSDVRKILWFAGCGAVGALIAALIGEVWLWATQGSPRVPTIGLVLDCSGSMSGPKLAEMKAAAVEFVESKSFVKSPISVTEFESGARVACPLTTDRARLVQSLQALEVSGSTNMSAGLSTALSTMPATGAERYMVIFTDGMPDSEQLATQVANACRSSGIKLIAVGTPDAERRYLQELTADPNLVFTAQAGEFAKAFQQVEQKLQNLVGSSDVSGGLWSPLRIAVWTALLALGIGICLIGGQNLYLGKPAWSGAAWWLGLIGCPLAGFAAGFLGETAFLGAASTSGFLLAIVRFIGWVVMGGLLGAGLARIVPNLKITRGLAGGAAGGALGVFGFGLIGLLLAEMLGRWAGAGIVGFCIGAMIAWIDAWLREASLEIDYGKGETRSVSLGREPVTVGSIAGKCTVYIPAPTPKTLRLRLDQGKVLCEDVEQGRTTPFLAHETRQVGKATLRLRGLQSSNGSAASTATAAAVSRSPASQPVTNVSGLVLPDANTNAATLILAIAWNQFPLTVGTRFTGQQIAGLEPDAPGDLVAEVQSNPQDPLVLGLKNRSRIAWQATNAAGTQLTIEPGRSVRIAAGTVVKFGPTEGKFLEA